MRVHVSSLVASGFHARLSFPIIRRLSLWLLVLAAVAATPALGRAEIQGGPGYAHARSGVPINDDFSGDTLETRYQFGPFGPAGDGTAYEASGRLYVITGPTPVQGTVELALQRYFHPLESFHIQIDAAISADSLVLGSAGMFIGNVAAFGDSMTIIGLNHETRWGGDTANVFSDIPGNLSADSMDIPFVADHFYTLMVDYDAGTQTMIISAPEVGYARLAVLPNYASGFSIGFFSHTESEGERAGYSKAVFDNLQSNLTADPYMVSKTALSTNGVVYDQAVPTDLLGGSAVYFISTYPYLALNRIAANDTWVQLNGTENLHAYLVDAAGRKATLYSTLPEAQIAAFGYRIDAAKADVFVAHGFGNDYGWELTSTPPPPPAPFTCGLGCGRGSCSTPVPAAGNDSSVNLASGNLYHHTTVVAAGPFSAGPQFSYNAKNGTSVMGRGWSHAEMSYTRTNAQGLLTLITPSGGELTFANAGLSFFPVVEGCCSSDYLGATISAEETVIYHRNLKADHYPPGGGPIQKTTDPNGRTWRYEYRPDGKLSASSDPYGRRYLYEYSDAGQLQRITDPLGHATSLTVENGLLKSVTDARGATETYAYNAAGQLSEVVDKVGFRWQYGYDAAGRTVAVTDPTGATTRISYAASGTSATVNDRRGFSKTYEFDPRLNVITRVVDPLGRVTRQTYDSWGNPVSKTDAAGFTTRTEFDLTLHVPTREVDSLGGVKEMTYNPYGLLLTEKDPNGNLTSYGYDERFNLVGKTDALGNTERWAYDPEGNKTSHTNRVGDVEIYEYTRGVLTAATNGAGERTVFEIDELGRVVATVDGEGFRTELNLDPLGATVRSVLPDGFVTWAMVDGLGREISTYPPSEPNQAVVSKTYDANGLITTLSTFMDFSATRGYDREGNQTTERSAAGRERRFSYDGAGQNVETFDADGRQQYAQYDSRGMYAKITDANNANTFLSYDPLGRLTRVVIDDYVSETVFDANGNRIQETVNGRTTRSYFDALNRVTATTDPLGNTSRVVYDAEGRAIQKIDALGRSTRVTFDGAGRVKRQTNPDGGTVTSEYNARGLKVAEVDPQGHRTQSVFDARGRLVDKIDPLGGHWRREYDTAGRVVAEENPLGERTLVGFDADGRMTSKTDPLGRVTRYEWDADRNLTATIEPDGTRRLKTYTAKNDVASEQAVAGDPATTVQFVHDAAGKITRYVDENGHSRSYAYNLKGELGQITDALGNTISFTRNVDGLVTRKVYSGAGVVAYTFDQNLRMVKKVLNAPGAMEQSDFAFDAANQLTSRAYTLASPPEIGQSGRYAYGHDLEGRETAMLDAAGGGVEYTWDSDGNRTSVSIPGTDYLVTTTYDANHRPVRLVDESTGDSWVFGYDAANRRRSVIYPDGSAVFTSYDSAGLVTEERAISITGQILFLEQNTFDLRGNITRTVTQDEMRQYAYNARDWLVSMNVTTNGGARYTQALAYDNAGNLIRQELRNPSGSKLPFNEVFPSQDGTPALTDNIVITYQYNAGDQLVRETGRLDSGKIHTADYRWDGAGNMAAKIVIDFIGRIHYNQMTWSAENRLLKQTGEVNFMNPSLVEGYGKEQNTWALDRTALNGTFRSYTYDHLSRHVIQEGSSSSPIARYVVGPQRDELLGAQLKSVKGLVKMYTYGNHRHDVLSVQAGNAIFTTSRRYLPTGVAISDPQTVSKGMPPGVPLPSQVPSNMPATPLAYGWQGKEYTNQGIDFDNRFSSFKGAFLSKDPRLEQPQPVDEELDLYLFEGNNTISNVDPDGLTYTTSNCTSVYRDTIWHSMKIVDKAIGSGCISNTMNLTSCMRGGYNSVKNHV